jgi:transcriptional regulator with XRE-family HTH domain
VNASEKLKKLREELGLSQAELGELLNVSKATISAWEVGRRTLTNTQQLHIAKVLKVPTFKIFSDEVIDSFEIKTDDELIERIKEDYSKLSGDKKLEVLRAILGE